MAAINLVPTEDPTKYTANIRFMNLKPGSLLDQAFTYKLMKMWNDFCELSNAPDGVIAAINKWADDNNIPGDSQEYTDFTNDAYYDILSKMCEQPEYQGQLPDGTTLKMVIHMDPHEAGVFDVEVVLC